MILGSSKVFQNLLAPNAYPFLSECSPQRATAQRRTTSADARARRVRNLHGYLSVDHAPPLDQVRRPMRKPIRAARIVSARMCIRLQREGSISGRRPNRRPKGRTSLPARISIRLSGSAARFGAGQTCRHLRVGRPSSRHCSDDGYRSSCVSPELLIRKDSPTAPTMSAI